MNLCKLKNDLKTVPHHSIGSVDDVFFGGWSAGVIYDAFGSYYPAFATGLAANILNFAILAGLLVVAWRRKPAANPVTVTA